MVCRLHRSRRHERLTGCLDLLGGDHAGALVSCRWWSNHPGHLDGYRHSGQHDDYRVDLQCGRRCVLSLGSCRGVPDEQRRHDHRLDHDGQDHRGEDGRCQRCCGHADRGQGERWCDRHCGQGHLQHGHHVSGIGFGHRRACWDVAHGPSSSQSRAVHLDSHHRHVHRCDYLDLLLGGAVRVRRHRW